MEIIIGKRINIYKYRRKGEKAFKYSYFLLKRRKASKILQCKKNNKYCDNLFNIPPFKFLIWICHRVSCNMPQN